MWGKFTLFFLAFFLSPKFPCLQGYLQCGPLSKFQTDSHEMPGTKELNELNSYLFSFVINVWAVSG